MVSGLCGVIGIYILQAIGVNAQKRVVRKKQRPALWRTKRQRVTKVRCAIGKPGSTGPAIFINSCRNTVGSGRCRQHICNQAFVPATDGNVHIPIKSIAPVPVKNILVIFSKPIPLYIIP